MTLFTASNETFVSGSASNKGDNTQSGRLP